MTEPPSVLTGTYVVAYAHADDTVQFEQRYTLSVDGARLGRVPCLALCQEFETLEFAIQYCNDQWYLLGIASGYKSAEEAMERAERSYHGITAKWTSPVVTKEQAFAAYTAELKAENCSFCGRTPLEVTSMFGAETRICNCCVARFHGMLWQDPDKT
jgi:hypothetical protein